MPSADRKRNDERSDLSQPKPGKLREGLTPQPTEVTKKLSPFAAGFVGKLHNQLRKDGLTSPQWPSEPGNPNKRGAMDKMKETFKKYRTKVYASLRKAELIDDPDKRRRLEDALPFKGVCEDMCPEYEQVTRICEYDVKHEEKEPAPDGLTMWPAPARMVKKFGRSAAGQDAPLPMDVRSVDALRRTTDYLLGNLLKSDADLPALHNYLWDRTRAVRKDFTFHSTKSPDEMKVLVYCFETITRFHATALHLLSRKGFAAEDFEQKQEIEQLGRSLLSLIEAYDDCRDRGVKCENEPEFRAYHLLLNTHDPFIVQRSLEWGTEYWDNSDDIQLVFSFIHAMQSVEEQRGPLRPMLGSTLSDSSFTNFFSIVESPQVSYTMACFAEIHFTHVRQCILKSLVKAYSRRRDSPRDITASVLNRMLRFDTDEEAVLFAERHGFQFSSENADQPYLELKSKRKHVPSPRVPQSYSGQLVERKRNKQSLSYIIHNTIYEEGKPEPAKEDPESPDSLFVSQTTDLPGKNIEVQKQGSAISAPQPAAAPSFAATSITTNGFPSSNGAFSGAFSGPPKPSSGPQQAASAFFPVPTSTSGPAPSQATTTTSAGPPPSFQQPSSFAPQNQPMQASAAATSSPANSIQSAFPPKQATPGGFSFLNKPSENSQSQAASSVLPVPAKSGLASSFFPGLPSTSTKDNVPSLTFSPPTSTGQHGHTGQATGALQGVKFPTPQPSVLPSVSNKSDAPATSFFPPTAGSKEATSAQGTQAGLAGPSSSSTTGINGSATNEIQPPLPLGGSVLSQPPASQTTAAAGAKSSQPPNFPPQTQQPSPVVPAGVAKPSQASLSSTALAPARPQTTPSDPMAGLTKWYVSGDGGLMEQFTETTVMDLLQETFVKWQEEEAERKRKEEDDKSWEAARKHQIYNLRVKYFYRWQKNARTLAHRRILREGRAKMKAYREKERATEKARKDLDLKAQEDARRKARAEEDIAKLLNWDVGKASRLSTEEQLLASGIFAGLKDERETVRRVIKEVSLADAKKQQQPSRRSSIASSQETASAPVKREGWKTRSLREKYGAESRMRRSERRSNSVSSSANAASDFSRSLPAAKITNFSRKRYADESSEDEPSPKRKANGFKSKHWELRARGLVQMPDGQWLPESIALPMQEGKRFKGIGDCGLGPGKEVMDEAVSEEERSNSPGADATRLRLERLAARFGLSKPRAHTTSGAIVNGTVTPAAKRKRAVDDDYSPPINGGLADGSSPPSAKKLAMDEGGDDTQRMVQSTQQMLQELKDTMDKMDEDRPWFRQQIELMEKRQSMWD